MAPRLGTGQRPHSGAAAAADVKARATSAAPPRATCAITVSSDGRRFSKVRPSFDCTSASLIQCPTSWGYMYLSRSRDFLVRRSLSEGGSPGDSSAGSEDPAPRTSYERPAATFLAATVLAI